ncbi:transcriptional regulator PpsR [Shimia ponticola]|uniref:transcriptional regulator PpsR n=1 Tax=Shimia ponticola TaxID=2582893 RepID=UPI00164BBED1|nr:transcriptional regulator PpsR [Shimia ponticola]
MKYWSTGSIPLIAPELLGGIISSASDLALVIDADGKIMSVLVNQEHRSLGKLEHWEGRDVRDFLTPESVPKLDQKLETLDSPSGLRAVELNHIDQTAWEFPIRYTFHRIGPDGALLMLGRDLRPIAEMQQQLVKAQIALERDYETQREFDTRYRVLMDTTREAVVFVQVGNGRVTDVNPSAANLLGGTRDDLIGQAFAQEFEGRRRGEFLESLTNAALSDRARPLTLQARRSRKRINIIPTVFRASGERLLLCRVELADQSEVMTDELSENLSALYQEGVDAIVFTDKEGIIRSANESFLNLTDLAHLTGAKGKSLGDFLARGTVDLKVLLENAARAGQMRMYATKLAGEYSSTISVEISVTYLNDRAHPSYVFVIRDASRVEAVRKPGVAVTDDAVRSVMELVGSASLKDIVSETTDVVEKMCIETAVELTRNNRVAAAEMLGLSRQSLYVKLRKYGLLAKDG